MSQQDGREALERLEPRILEPKPCLDRFAREDEERGEDDQAVDVDYLRVLVNRRLGLLVPSESAPPQRLHRAVRYALMAPGKRVRPLMCIVAAHAAGRTDLAPIEAGCAIEMVHTASLILDDLPSMDDAALRRGMPSTHRKFGEGTAILGAITLLNRAFGVLASIDSLSGALRSELVCVLSEVVGSAGLAAGQEQDLHDRASLTDERHIDDLNRLKTGVLFVASARLGGMIAGVADSDLDHLSRFAERFGMAYQTADDLLDATATPELAGKDTGQDADKPTIVSLAGVEAARARIRLHAEDADRALSRCAFDTAPLSRFLTSFVTQTASLPAAG